MPRLCSQFLTLAVVSVTLIAACSRKSPETKDTTEWIKADKLQQGEIKHDSLSDSLVAKIKHFQSVFAEVDPTPLDKWIEDFRRDAHPENEISIYEDMAAAYESYTRGRVLSLDVKRDVYSIVLLRSGAPEDQVLQHAKLKILTNEEAKIVMQGYKTAPKPITVIQK